MNRLTNHIKLTDFFGVLSPGFLLVFALLLLLIGISFLMNINVELIFRINNILQGWCFIISIFCFFIAYLLGSIVRLFANDFAEILSGVYNQKIRKKNDKLFTERFPYPFAGSSFKDSHPEIFKWYKEKYKYFGEEMTLSQWERKYFFNKCKADLYVIAPERAAFYEGIESYVRFLAGSLVAIIILFLITLIMGLVFILFKKVYWALFYLIISLSSSVIIIGILERFRHQHTREVMTMWTSYYEASQEKIKKESQQVGSADSLPARR